MLLCSLFADDCSSCVERSFKVHELVEKACQEFDFGKKRLVTRSLIQPRTGLVSAVYSTVGILTGLLGLHGVRIFTLSLKYLGTQELVHGDI